MCRTFTYADRPNNIKYTSSLYVKAVCLEVIWPDFVLSSTIQRRGKTTTYSAQTKTKGIPNFSKNVETSGLWPHLDSKYFLTDIFFTSWCLLYFTIAQSSSISVKLWVKLWAVKNLKLLCWVSHLLEIMWTSHNPTCFHAKVVLTTLKIKR